MKLTRLSVLCLLGVLSALSGCKKSSPSIRGSKKASTSENQACGKPKDLNGLGLMDTREPIDPATLTLDNVGAYDLEYSPTSHTLVVYAFADATPDAQAPDYVTVEMLALDSQEPGVCPTKVNLGGAYYNQINMQADYPSCKAKSFMIKAKPCVDEGRSTNPATNCGDWVNATDTVDRILSKSQGDLIIQRLKSMQTLEDEVEQKYDAMVQPAVQNLMAQIKKTFGDSANYSAQVNAAGQAEGGSALGGQWVNLYVFAQNLSKNHSIFKAFLKSPVYEDLTFQAQEAMKKGSAATELQLADSTGAGCGLRSVVDTGSGSGSDSDWPPVDTASGTGTGTGAGTGSGTGAGTGSGTGTGTGSGTGTDSGTGAATADGPAPDPDFTPSPAPAATNKADEQAKANAVSVGIGAGLLVTGVAFFGVKLGGYFMLQKDLRSHLQGLGVDKPGRIVKFEPGKEISWYEGNELRIMKLGEDAKLEAGDMEKAKFENRYTIEVNGKQIVLIESVDGEGPEKKKTKKELYDALQGDGKSQLSFDEKGDLMKSGAPFLEKKDLPSEFTQKDLDAMKAAKEVKFQHSNQLVYTDAKGKNQSVLFDGEELQAKPTGSSRIADGKLVIGGESSPRSRVIPEFKPRGWTTALTVQDAGWYDPRSKNTFDHSISRSNAGKHLTGILGGGKGLAALFVIAGSVAIANGSSLTSSDLGAAFQRFSDAIQKYGAWLDTQKPKIWQAHDDMVDSVAEAQQ